MKMRGMRWIMGLGLVTIGLTACDDLLTVSDPQRYTTEDLDKALEAVANGAEGQVHSALDAFTIYQALLADEYQHTGTWQGYDEVDHGRIFYGNSAMNGTMNTLLRGRWFADDAEERFKRVLGDGPAASSPLTAQTRLAGGMADLYLGMAFCEAPVEAEGPAGSDRQLYEAAVNRFTRAIEAGDASGRQDIVRAATAGRARAHLLTENWAAAAADAAQVPDDFIYYAQFNAQATNSVVQLTTATFNKAAGLMHKWWDLIGPEPVGPTFMRDPWTGELDRRIRVHWDGGRSTDNETPHYSQWKYDSETSDIPMLHGHEMRLIEAEVLMRQGDYAGAMSIINALRAKVELPALEVPTSETMMRDILLSERFAEMFMQGVRAVDLYRFGITREIFAALNDPERSPDGRPTKFPMSTTEAINNPNINDNIVERCLPTT